MITATFKNGNTATYKGHRDVKAAWRFTTPEGLADTGFSLDTKTAEKTARGNAAQHCHVSFMDPRGPKTLGQIQWQEKQARAAGFKSHRARVTDAKARRADYLNKCNFEIIPL